MALAGTMTWECRTTGSDTVCSGGFDPGVSVPGTDYTQQDTAQIAFTDLVIGATNTQLTSIANPFSSVHPGNTILITGGTGFTTGLYEILSVSGVTATMDRAIGTAGSTGGSGYLGGGLATPGQAMAYAVVSNTVYIKNTGTKYVLSGSLNVSGGRINITVGGTTVNAPFQIIGYKTNRTLTNSDSPPQLDAAAAVGAFAHIAVNSSYVRIRNLNMTNTSGGATGASYSIFFGAQVAIAELCTSDQMPYGFYFGAGNSFTTCEDCVATRFTTAGFFSAGGNNLQYCNFCYAANGTGVGFYGLVCDHCIAYNNSGTASDGFDSLSAGGISWRECVAYGNGRSGFLLYYDGLCVNCIAVNNGNTGFDLTVANNGSLCRLYNCAAFGNTNGDKTGGFPSWTTRGFLSLTGDPFTSPTTGDFSLNSTAGAGKKCKAAGYPASYNGLSTKNYEDVGAAQSPVPAATTCPPAATVIPTRLFREHWGEKTPELFADELQTLLTSDASLSKYAPAIAATLAQLM